MKIFLKKVNFYSSISLSGSGSGFRIRIQHGNLNPDPKHCSVQSTHEPGHNGGGELDVLLERLAPVVLAVDGVGRGEDAGARVEGGLHPRLGDGDGLLLHGLVYGHLVVQVHLVKLVCNIGIEIKSNRDLSI